MLNQKYFLLFLLYTATSSIFCGAFLIWKMVHCMGNAVHFHFYFLRIFLTPRLGQLSGFRGTSDHWNLQLFGSNVVWIVYNRHDGGSTASYF
jgi:hypothetical protein